MGVRSTKPIGKFGKLNCFWEIVEKTSKSVQFQFVQSQNLYEKGGKGGGCSQMSNDPATLAER